MDPLTPRERKLVLVLTIVVAATRFLAISRSLWDWDEALFALALRDYDVTRHHPHPPGFPLFILAAKAITLLGVNEFRALQTVSVAASLFVFPAMFLFARALRATFFTSIAAALILAFLPNVWFFGGTALSDVPSMVLAVAACALLLRGNSITGAILLGIAVGFRPQNLLIGAAPLLLRRNIKGAVIVGVIGAASFLGAAHFSGGWDAWRAAVTRHETYIRSIDSFLSDIRPPLWKVADDFFFRPFRAPAINLAIALLIACALVRRTRATLIALATFGPFVVFAWLYLDFHSSSRFSVAYMPLFAFLAAEGLEVFRRVRGAVLAALVVTMIVWTLPPLHTVRTTISPPQAAAEWILAHHRGPVDVDPRLGAQAAYFFADREVEEGRTLRMWEGSGGAVTFTRERARLARALTRPRYFEVSVRW